MPNQRSSASFDLIAPVYDRLAKLVYGRAQQKAQARFLPSVPAGAHVLIVGGGTGWVLPELLRVAQPRQVLFLEASAKMLRQAQARLDEVAVPIECEILFRHGTEADLLPDERFHVVMTPFVLDLFSMPEARKMMQKLDTHLLPNGLWLHTDFHESKDGLHGIWQRPMLWAMYRFFGWVSHISGKHLPAFEVLFPELEYALEVEAHFYSHFICAQKYRKPSG
jgi:tRNA (cmo5U34)-methyltransferase